MYNFLINYDEPLFRPPSEAQSLILQVTLGCSHNKCAFCEMYSNKKFKVRDFDDILNDIKIMSAYSENVKKIFLADGDAMVLSTNKLLRILQTLREYFPKLRRVSAYAKPKDLDNKTASELKELNDAGLNLVYVGIESGDDELLRFINKGETYESTVRGLQKARTSGFKTSVMVLNGLGGKKYSEQHALNSAKVINEIQPEYLSTLVLSFPFGINTYINRFKGDYISMNQIDLISEMKLFIETAELNNTIFRSDHASNYLVLKGILPRDKNDLVSAMENVIRNPHSANLRDDKYRGL